MKKSILNGKWILVVDNDPNVLMVLEEKILRTALNCHIDRATTYQEAVEKMICLTYDAVILDSMGTQDFDLLNLALMRNFPVAMLTTPTLNPELLNQTIKMGVRACLPKENLREIIPFLEDVVRNGNFPGWRHLLEGLTGLFRSKLKSGWQGKSRFELKSAGRTESIS